MPVIARFAPEPTDFWGAKTKRKLNIERGKISGFSSAAIIIVMLVVLAGFFYVYSINSGATKGYQIKQLEKDIGSLEQNNENLKIKEAQLKSLHNIEESSRTLNMAELKNISYIEETGPVALK